ncbi:MAG: hypothetical protein ACI9XR_000128 [Flavobacterium sp.]|jgi:hypothetical protein
MKKYIVFVLIVLSFSVYSQTAKVKTAKIKQGTEACKRGKQVKLVAIVSDNRCPQGAQCIQAGEAIVTVFVFDNKKLISQETVNLGAKNKQVYISDFEKATGYENIQDVSLKPYPLEGKETKLKEYYLEVTYLK